MATLKIPRQKFDDAKHFNLTRNLKFNPWHCLPEHRPLGNQSRARKRMYDELAKFRQRMNWETHIEPTGAELFEDAGLSVVILGERALSASLGGEFEAIFVRAQDIPEFVADPLLGPLHDNGGFTQTMALGSGSPAIDAVPTTGAGCAPTDQRGISRPQGAACDIGAFEFAPPVVKLTSPTNGARLRSRSSPQPP